MKNLRKNLLKKASLLLVIFFAGLHSGYAQKPDPKKDKIESMIGLKTYLFKAQTVIPQRGGTRYLTGEYDLKVSKDTIVAYLPYFGRIYSAPMNPSQGGIKFTSTDFTYTTEKKKRGWEITITPNDTRMEDVRYLILSISPDGYGTLRIFSDNREGIVFSGNIADVKEE